jgi:hypothetical protein
LYAFNESSVVSYHTIHSVGLEGAVAETIAQGNVFDISLLASIEIQFQAVNSSCLSSNALCKSVWSDNAQVIFHHSALVCVLDITLLASIEIHVPAVYFVSVALITF